MTSSSLDPEHLRAAAEVWSVVREAAGVEPALRAVLEAAARLTGATRAGLMLPDETGAPRLRLAQPELDGPALEAARQAIQAGTPARAPGGTALAVPLRAFGRVVGALAVDRSGAAFGPQAEAALGLLGGPAALAVEHERLEQAVQQTSEARAKFVSIVSHELKIPMTSIKGYADLLREGIVGPVTDQQLQFINIIRTNVERMAVLVSDLADISRLDTGRLKLELMALDPGACALEAVTAIRGQIERKEQRLKVDVPGDLPRVRADRHRLVQALAVLLSNAHKYSPRGADIRLRGELVAGAGQVRLSVQDTGIGIAPDDQARLFTQFFRSEAPEVREETGWGLGLHVARRLAQAMGGDLTLETSPGQGSTFYLSVPVD